MTFTQLGISEAYVTQLKKVIAFFLTRIRAILGPKTIKQPRKCPFYQHFRGSVRYSNSQSSICFVVFYWYSSFETVHLRTVLYGFATFSFNCIVILLSATYTTLLKIHLLYLTVYYPSPNIIFLSFIYKFPKIIHQIYEKTLSNILRIFSICLLVFLSIGSFSPKTF